MKPTAQPVQPVRQPFSYERDSALCEANCNTEADAFFAARPALDSDANRRIFYAGHRKAWINYPTLFEANIAQPVQPAAPDGSVHAMVRFADVEHVYHEREELAMMIRMLTSSLKRYTPHAPQPGDLPSRAVELLRKYGLMGSPLRDECDDRVPQQAA